MHAAFLYTASPLARSLARLSEKAKDLAHEASITLRIERAPPPCEGSLTSFGMTRLFMESR